MTNDYDVDSSECCTRCGAEPILSNGDVDYCPECGHVQEAK